MKRKDLLLPEFKISSGLVDYTEAVAEMEQRVLEIQEERASELIWFLEHPPLYTIGTSGKVQDILDRHLPVYRTGRGGQVTYHGPGQRVVYVMLDLNKRRKDLKQYVHHLEEWIIQSLQDLGVTSYRRDGRVGLWVPRDNNFDDKIAAIGVRVKKWVTFHGLAINVAPDLAHYQGIIPCGIQDHGVTSLKQLGKTMTLQDMDTALKIHFERVF